jgi:glycosyltransferase involved in cell wall biosynthesis
MTARGRGAGGTAFRSFARAASQIRARWFRDRQRPPLYESTILDDAIFGQPLNLVARAHRLMRRRRIEPDGVTVVVVNFNTRAMLETVLGAVRRLSPPGTEIVVVDNRSRDGSRAWLRGKPHDVRPILLPVNLGHGRALDIGLCRARHPVVVTLDSDAFPYADRWLETLLDALGEPGVAAAGMEGPRARLHPACAAYRRADVLATGLSFANYNPHHDRGEAPRFGTNTWDTGELLFERLGPDRVRLLPTSASELGGVDMAGVAYHHPGSTTILVDDDGRDLPAHDRGWHEAVTKLLGP